MSILSDLKGQLSKLSKTKDQPQDKMSIWRIITMMVIGTLIAGVFGALYFTYNNIYLTLNNAHTIFLLESATGADTVDSAGFEQAQKYLEIKKQETILPQNLRYIFTYGQIENLGTNTSTNNSD